MTIIQDRLEDVAGEGLDQSVVFTIPRIRESADSTAIVTEDRHRFEVVDGELLTTDLDPGPAKVQIAGQPTIYDIVIPESPTPIRLWPLIDAGMPAPPAESPGFIRSDDTGRLLVMPTPDFNNLTTLDPMTMYATYDV